MSTSILKALPCILDIKRHSPSVLFVFKEKESAQSKMEKELEEEKLKRENQSKMVETLKQKEEQLQEELVKKQVC